MRCIAFTLTAIGLIIGAVRANQTAGDEAAKIIDKAIKAHGIKNQDEKSFAYRGKSKGTLHIAGMDLDFTQSITMQSPDKFKEVLSLSVGGNMVTVTSVFNGKEGWVNLNGMDVPVEKDALDEFKEVAHMMRLSQAMFLKDKSLEISLLGEVKVNDKPAVGLKVSKKGQKDIDFYFDKATGLLAKTERRAKDPMGGQEVTEERIVTEYQEVKDRKIAKKVVVKRDGQAFTEAEVIEAQFLERVDDSEFAKPG